MKKRIILTGGSGLLAVNWAYKIRNDFDVLLFTHDHSVNIPGVLSQKVDLSSVKKIQTAINDFKADIVVHTAGMTNVDLCEKEPDKAFSANVGLSENVAIVCAETNRKLVHISTDHLFDGSKSLVTEEEPVNPINVYGLTKAKAEELVNEIVPDSLIIRTNFYGWGHKYRTSLSDWVIGLLESNKEVPAFNDSYFTPILIDHLLDAIHDLVNLGHSGTYNICGNKRISKYEFAKAIANAFAYESDLIKSTNINDASLYARRPNDMSLSNKKINNTLNKTVGDIEAGVTTLSRNNSDRGMLMDAVYTIR